MNIVLAGSTGYISGFVLEKLKKIPIVDQVITMGRNKPADCIFDLERPGDFDYEIFDDADFLIFTAAVSSPDLCSREYDRCWRINVDGTSHFMEEAIKRNCHIIFFSSDAVFRSNSCEIYNEDSDAEPVTAYGKMKKEVENRFKDERLFKALRLSYVISAKDKFTSYCLSCMKERKEAEVFHPFYRNCITMTDVIDVVVWMLKNYDVFKPGILNVAGRELVSRVRLADEFNNLFCGKLKYKISAPDKMFFGNRPCITQMESLYLYKYNIIEDEPITIKIRKELGECLNEC